MPRTTICVASSLSVIARSWSGSAVACRVGRNPRTAGPCAETLGYRRPVHSGRKNGFADTDASFRVLRCCIVVFWPTTTSLWRGLGAHAVRLFNGHGTRASRNNLPGFPGWKCNCALPRPCQQENRQAGHPHAIHLRNAAQACSLTLI